MRSASRWRRPAMPSRLTVAVLQRVYIGDDEYSVAELAATAMTDTGTMTREVRRLRRIGPQHADGSAFGAQSLAG